MALEAIRGCENDKTGKRFEPGDTVPADAFSKKVINHWLEIGVLKQVRTKKAKK